MATSEGFDWLYGEDAEGSVVNQPPAIGAVTERAAHGGVVTEEADFVSHEPLPPMPSFDETFDPMAAQDASPSFDETFDPMAAQDASPSFDETFDPMAMEEDAPAPAPSFDETFDPMAMEEDAPAPAPSFEDSFYSAEPEAPLGETSFVQDEFDPGELDASFGPPAPQAPAGGTFSTVQAAPESPSFSAPPPPPPPPPPAPTTTSVSEPTAMDEFSMGYALEDPADELALPAEMASVAPQAAVPFVPSSSRGDIIPAGNRKLSIRDHLTVSRAPKSKVKTKTSKSDAGGKKGMRSVAVVLSLVLGLAGTAWRFEKIRRLVFGGASAPTEEQVDASFVPLKGFAYTPLPAAQMEQMQSMAEQMMPNEVEHWDARLVGTPSNPAGMVMIFAVDPKLTTPQQWELEVQDAMSPSGGMSKGKEIKLAGSPAIVGTPVSDPAASVVIFQDPDGMLFFTFGRNANFALDAAKQLIKGNV